MAEDKKDTRAGTNTNTPPAEPPQYQWPDEQGRNWPRLIVLAVAAILVAALIVFGSRWIYRSLTDSPARDESTQTADEDKLPSGSSDTQTPTRDPQAPPSGQTGGDDTDNVPTTGDSAETGTTSLPDSGPGGVAALFAGTTGLVAAAHYALQRRR